MGPAFVARDNGETRRVATCCHDWRWHEKSRRGWRRLDRLTHGYERVPHITLKSIANNAEIDVIWERFQEKLEPLREKLTARQAIDRASVFRLNCLTNIESVVQPMTAKRQQG